MRCGGTSHLAQISRWSLVCGAHQEPDCSCRTLHDALRRRKHNISSMERRCLHGCGFEVRNWCSDSAPKTRKIRLPLAHLATVDCMDTHQPFPIIQRNKKIDQEIGQASWKKRQPAAKTSGNASDRITESSWLRMQTYPALDSTITTFSTQEHALEQ